jgi:hypothetical protein
MPTLVRRLLDAPQPRLTRAERRAARDLADERLVRGWLAANPNQPLGALHASRPLPRRRLRQALNRLTWKATFDA